MTRKDYVILARILKSWREDRQFAQCTRGNVFYPAEIARVNRWLQDDNPRFDIEKFWNAVGGT